MLALVDFFAHFDLDGHLRPDLLVTTLADIALQKNHAGSTAQIFDPVVMLHPFRLDAAGDEARPALELGVLELGYIIVAGALAAIVGDSLLYWIARTVGRRIIAEKMEQARKNNKVDVALEVLGTTAPLLISAGRFVPGVRFAVNAMMGLSLDLAKIVDEK